MENPLNNHPRVREVVYAIWWTLSGVTGVTMGAYLAVQPQDVPTPVLVAVLVVSLSGTYLGFTAQRNVTGNDTRGVPVTANRAMAKGSGLDV